MLSKFLNWLNKFLGTILWLMLMGVVAIGVMVGLVLLLSTIPTDEEMRKRYDDLED